MADNARTFCFLLSTVQSKLAAANSAAFFFFFLMLGLVFDHPFLIIGAGLVNLVAYRASDSLRGCFCHGEAHQFSAVCAELCYPVLYKPMFQVRAHTPTYISAQPETTWS